MKKIIYSKIMKEMDEKSGKMVIKSLKTVQKNIDFEILNLLKEENRAKELAIKEMELKIKMHELGI